MTKWNEKFDVTISLVGVHGESWIDMSWNGTSIYEHVPTGTVFKPPETGYLMYTTWMTPQEIGMPNRAGTYTLTTKYYGTIIEYGGQPNYQIYTQQVIVESIEAPAVTCPTGQHYDETLKKCVTTVVPPPTPPPPTPPPPTPPPEETELSSGTIHTILAEITPPGELVSGTIHTIVEVPTPPPSTVCDELTKGLAWPFADIVKALCRIWMGTVEAWAGFLAPIVKPISDAIGKIETNIWNSLPTELKQPWLDFQAFLKDPWKPWNDFVKRIEDAIGRLETAIWNNLPQWLQQAIQNAQLFFADPWAGLNAEFQGLLDVLKDPLGAISTELGKISAAIWAELEKLMPQTIKNIEAFSKDPMTAINAFGTEVGKGLANVGNVLAAPLMPFARLFDPSRFASSQFKEIATSIQNAFTSEGDIFSNLYDAVFNAPWRMVYADIEALLVPTTEGSYEDAKARATGLLEFAGDLSLIIAALDAIDSILPSAIRMGEAIPRSLRLIFQSASFIASIDRIFSQAFSIGVSTPLQHQWQSMARPALQDRGTLRELFLREEISEEYHDQQLAMQGFSDEKIAEIKLGYFLQLSRGELFTLLHRGRISQEAFNALVKRLGLDQRFQTLNPETGELGTGKFDAWTELAYSNIGIRYLRQLYQTGLLNRAGLETKLRTLGYSPENVKLIADVWEELIGSTQRQSVISYTAKRVVAGTVPEADYYAKASEYRVSKTVADLLLEIEGLKAASHEDTTAREATVSNLGTWYKNGIVTADEYRVEVLSLGYGPIYVDRQLKYLDQSKAIPTTETVDKQRELTQSVWLSAYREGAIQQSDALAKLLDLGYDTPEAELLLQIEDLKRIGSPKRITNTDLKDAWTQGIIHTITQPAEASGPDFDRWQSGALDEEYVTNRLIEQAYPANDITILLELWRPKTKAGA